MKSPKEWLEKENNICNQERVERLKWLKEKYSDIETAQFPGGIKSNILFEEARYCFVYGQFFATVLLSLAYIENTLVSLFYGAGEDDVKNFTAYNILKRAVNKGAINDEEFSLFDDARKLRNPIAHFREPVDKERLEIRAIKTEKQIEGIMEEDAKTALSAMFKVFELYQS